MLVINNNPLTPMIAHLFLAIYLIIVGLTVLFGLSLPPWIAGLTALIAGILLLAGQLGVSVHRKGSEPPAGLG